MIRLLDNIDLSKMTNLNVGTIIDLFHSVQLIPAFEILQDSIQQHVFLVSLQVQIQIIEKAKFRSDGSWSWAVAIFEQTLITGIGELGIVDQLYHRLVFLAMDHKAKNATPQKTQYKYFLNINQDENNITDRAI